jgi:hypothetical protein
MRACNVFTLGSIVFVLSASTALPQGADSGSLRGRITDSSGAALPGVTVTASSPAVMGGKLAAVTSPEGLYRIPALPPGDYEITMELTGFKTVSLPGTRINVGMTLTIDRVMEIAPVEEAVTVVGESPIIDTKATSSEFNWTTPVLQNIPSGRDLWAYLQQVPGLMMAKENVGGFESVQLSTFQVHGSGRASHQYNFNGIDMSDMHATIGLGYFNTDAFEEIQFTTSGITAEYQRGGMVLNTVVKSGGNQFKGLVASYYEGSGLQSDNLNDELRAKGVLTGAPLDYLFDFSAQLGGPIWKDRIWFFEAFREYQVDPFVINCTLPNGQQCIDQSHLRNYTTKVTAQFNPENRVMAMYEWGRKLRPNREVSQFRTPESAYFQDGRHLIGQFKYDRIISSNTLFQFTTGWGSPPFPITYQDAVQGRSTGFDEITRVRFDAAPQDFYQQGDILTFGSSLTYFKDNWLDSAHDFKFGWEHRRGKLFQRIKRNQDLERRYQRGVPYRVIIYNTPVEQVARNFGFAGYAQDSVRVGNRLTLNLGLRVEWWRGDIPEQANPAGRFAEIFGAGTFPAQEGVMGWTTVSPRLGGAFDLRGDSKTVLKASFSRYFSPVISGDLNNFANRNGVASATYDWTDLNGNNFPDYPSEFGVRRSLDLPRLRNIVPGLESPYSTEVTASIDQTVTPQISVSARYTYRRNSLILAETDLALPDEAFSIPSTVVNPLNGEVISFWSLGPQFASVTNQRVLSQFEDNWTRYHGVDLVFNRRLHNRWMLIASLTLQDNYGRVGGFLDRNEREINAYGSVDLDAPYTGKVMFTYVLPHEFTFSGFFRHTTGMNIFEGANEMARIIQGRDVTTRTLYRLRTEPNGEFRQDSTNIVDLRFSKIFRIGGRTLEAMLDAFNLTNANNVLKSGVIIGSDLGIPTRILPPRVLRVGFKFDF